MSSAAIAQPDATFTEAAQALLAEEGDRPPNLSACTVLVPHFHVAASLLSALRGQIEQPVFLPPRILTLPALAARQPTDTSPEPEALRMAQLQAVLADSGLLADAALWPAARQLLQLLDELSHQLLSPPADFQAFRRQCEVAYGRGLTRPLEREARLVFDLWHAMAQGDKPDGVAVYARRLARAAEQATGPLYCLGLTGLTRLENRFLEQWARRQPVRELPVPAGLAGRRDMLGAIWRDEPAEQSLGERAADIRQTAPDSPFRDGLRLLPAAGLEGEARGAAEAIHAWIGQGLEHIGIVALDRMAARRLRALLERHGVLVQDETGWTFSTAAVSHVLDRLASLVADDCYYQDLLDLLKSPFVFADLDRVARLEQVAELEAAIRANGAVEGMTRYQRLAREQAPASLPLLQRLGQALERLSVRRDTLSGWLRRLLLALEDLGAVDAFRGDVAGSQLLNLLQGLTAEVAPHPVQSSFARWRAWLLQQLETATFVDTGIDSPLRLTSLTGARLRAFQAVLVMGADAGHLPAASPPGIFNEALRAELGLPGRLQSLEEQRQHLADILAQTPQVLVTWQATREGDPNPLSPWLELLDTLHRLTYGRDLRMPGQASFSPQLPVSHGTPPPRPFLARLPETLSASAWQSLVACPYQFFARYGLGLREVEEVAEGVEKRDYGQVAHDILRAFHQDHPRLAEMDRQTLVDELERISRSRFAPLLEAHYLALAWQARWLRQVPAYVDWAVAREADGYTWQAAEVQGRVEMDLGDGVRVTLVGRLDRLDRGEDGLAVLDYKTQSRDVLRRKLKEPGEDVQLPFYGLLSGAGQAAFVALDDPRLGEVPWPGDLGEAARREARRIADTWTALAGGTPLPALGAAHTCQWCEMRGLCRRDYWPVDGKNPG